MSLQSKSYDVTIEMKALCLYFHMVIFVCQNFRQRNLEFGRNLPLASFGRERVHDISLATAFLFDNRCIYEIAEYNPDQRFIVRRYE